MDDSALEGTETRLGASSIARACRFMRLAQWEIDLASQRFRWSDEAREIYRPSDGGGVRDGRAPLAGARRGPRGRRALSRGRARDRVPADAAPTAANAWSTRRRRSSISSTAGALLVGATQDVTALRNAERHARHLAYFDSLTRLPNRAYLRHFLEQALASARRHNGRAAVLALDLDGFKRVNDTLGHAGGDELLREVAARITGSVRACDSVAAWGGSVAARLGGDEFVVVLTHLRKARGCRHRREAHRRPARRRRPGREHRGVRLVEHRHRDVSRERRRRRYAPQSRRRRDVPGEGARPQSLPLLHGVDAGEGPRADGAREQPALRARARADRRSARRPSPTTCSASFISPTSRRSRCPEAA